MDKEVTQDVRAKAFCDEFLETSKFEPVIALMHRSGRMHF